jgi:hypothetical protein
VWYCPHLIKEGENCGISLALRDGMNLTALIIIWLAIQLPLGIMLGKFIEYGRRHMCRCHYADSPTSISLSSDLSHSTP